MVLLLSATSKGKTMQVNNTPIKTPPPPATPNLVLDLSKWKLTLPININGLEQMGTTAISKTTAQLLAGYSSTYFSVSADTGVTFWCPIDGATTSPGIGSDHPRTELGETYYWNTSSTGQMNNVVAINQYPSNSKNIIIGQIHGAGTTYSSYPFVLLNIVNGTLKANIKGELSGNANTQKATLLTNVALNKKITYSIVCDGTNIHFTASCPGATGIGSWTGYIPAPWVGITAKFSAGDYVQDTGASSTDGGKVTFYQLNIAHNPLPVSLSYFKAKKITLQQINLSWATATETNNNYFSIDRSQNGKAFESIGTINGNYNSSVVQQYSFTDKNPYQGVNYYRLKQVDLNGKYSYSDIEKVEINNQASTTVSSLIEGNIIKVNYFGTKDAKANLYNSLGQSFGTFNLSAGGNLLKINKINTGIYYLNINNEVFKIIK